jgi:hypothetical protein
VSQASRNALLLTLAGLLVLAGIAFLATRALTAVTSTSEVPGPTAIRVPPATTLTPPTPTPFAAACQGRDSAAYIYHPNRLILLEACVTAVGTVRTLRAEPDGDVHIQLLLDSGQESLLNGGNRAQQSGALVVEIICFGTVTQADAIDACATYSNTVTLPSAGSRIAVTGPHVLDTEHDWMEIHPVYEWHVAP